VHRRDFTTTGLPASGTGIAELTDARSRRLETQLNTPAKLTFTVDGRSPACAEVAELQTDIVAWRSSAGVDVPMFRGVVTQSEDVVSEQAHAVNFTCHDYLAVLTRRYLTANTDLTYTQVDQDDLVVDLVGRASTLTATGGHSFGSGARLPLSVAYVDPDGRPRGVKSGERRDRTYPGGTSIGQAITDLAAVVSMADPTRSAYDVDVGPSAAGFDHVRLWYPARGVPRSDLALTYPGNVGSFTRSVNSQTYASYVRVIGDAGGTEGAPQLTADAWTADANGGPVGLWMESDNESDVKVAATLAQKASGYLTAAGVLVPSYSLTLAPGWYELDAVNLGDTVRLVLESGRLHVASTVRVLGIGYAIADDLEAGEDVEVTVGRPAVDLSAMFRPLRRDIDALARR
jgi:hypothetical protein